MCATVIIQTARLQHNCDIMIEVSSADIRFLGSEGYRLVIKMNGVYNNSSLFVVITMKMEMSSALICLLGGKDICYCSTGRTFTTIICSWIRQDGYIVC